MSYRKHVLDYLDESRDVRLENRDNRPSIEIWPDDDEALWVAMHSDPARDIIWSTPEYGDTPFCGMGFH